jgi:hypothetical protein
VDWVFGTDTVAHGFLTLERLRRPKQVASA